VKSCSHSFTFLSESIGDYDGRDEIYYKTEINEHIRLPTAWALHEHLFEPSERGVHRSSEISIILLDTLKHYENNVTRVIPSYIFNILKIQMFHLNFLVILISTNWKRDRDSAFSLVNSLFVATFRRTTVVILFELGESSRNIGFSNFIPIFFQVTLVPSTNEMALIHFSKIWEFEYLFIIFFDFYTLLFN